MWRFSGACSKASADGNDSGSVSRFCGRGVKPLRRSAVPRSSKRTRNTRRLPPSPSLRRDASLARSVRFAESFRERRRRAIAPGLSPTSRAAICGGASIRDARESRGPCPEPRSRRSPHGRLRFFDPRSWDRGPKFRAKSRTGWRGTRPQLPLAPQLVAKAFAAASGTGGRVKRQDPERLERARKRSRISNSRRKPDSRRFPEHRRPPRPRSPQRDSPRDGDGSVRPPIRFSVLAL